MTLSPTPLVHFAAEGLMQFEKSTSVLRDRVYSEVVSQGETATFNVVGTDNLIATTRNLNGLIPAQQVNRTQKTATLVEKNILFQHTAFDLFASQNGVKKAMDNAVAAINRDIDTVIQTALSGASTNTLSGVASLQMVNQAIVKLSEANAGGGPDNMTALVSPSFIGQLRQIEAFNSAEFVDLKPYTTNAMEAFRFMGVMFIVDPELTGVGTASSINYFFHRNAIGWAYNSGSVKFKAGYDDEQSYYYTGADLYHGAVLLQETGVVKITHDDSQLT